MNNQTTITCPHCQTEFPLTEALANEYETKAQEKAEEKIRREMELEVKNKANEAEELKKQNKDLQNQLLELNKSLRELARTNEQRDLEYQKKLATEEEKIRTEVKNKTDEEHKLKEAEKEKVISDLKTALEEAQKKASQGSQQTQGEVQELILEDLLKKEFPQDEILPVSKGVRGGDALQKVFAKNGRESGQILWESKQTKAWSEGWVAKLKEDQREAKADLAVIVSSVLPDKIKKFGYYLGIWVTSLDTAIELCWALRFHLVQAASIRQAAEVSKDDKDELYKYVTSSQFAQRVGAMMDAYQQILEDAEKEKKWFVAKWARQEKSVRTLMEQTGGVYGELGGIVGKALPNVRNLSLEE